MSERNKVTVKIADKEYTIIADESREYIHKVADHVDRKMSLVSQRDSRLSTAMIAVLTAINTTDEYLKAKAREEELSKAVAEYTDKINQLQREVDNLKRNNRNHK